MLFDLGNSAVLRAAKDAEFGIERESLRVNLNGTLAQTPHPFKGNPHIDRDFCENQVEIIGDVFGTAEELNRQLHDIQNQIGQTLAAQNELLWAFSNPPKISGEDEIPVARFNGGLREKTVYRNYLAEKYGKKKMLFCGIHLNFSFTEELLRTVFLQSEESDFRRFKDDLYLQLAARLVQYCPLIIYLTAASPVADSSLGTESGKYSSVRCSKEGYWNTFTPVLDYTSLDGYVRSVARYVQNGDLRSASELYYPVRVKPRGVNRLEALLENGVNHLELRVLDVNPLSRTGIFTEDIRFIHLLLLYLSSLPEAPFGAKQQEDAIAAAKSAAEYGNEAMKETARRELDKIQAFTARFFPEWLHLVRYQQQKLEAGESYAERVSAAFSADYMAKGIALAKDYQRSVDLV